MKKKKNTKYWINKNFYWMNNLDNFVQNIEVKNDPFKKDSQPEYEGDNPNLMWKVVNNDALYGYERYKMIENRITEYSDELTEEDLKNCVQGSNAWLRMRNYNTNNKSPMFEKRIIGMSQISQLLGFFSPYCFKKFGVTWKIPKKQFLDDFYEAVNNKKKIFSEENNLKMEWGKKHELSGVCAFLKKYQEAIIKESGSYFIPMKDNKHFHYICSPDGFYSMEKDGEVKEGCIECKASFPWIYEKKTKKWKYIKKRLWKKIPHYYIPQGQGQMKGTKMNNNCYICITPTDGIGFYWVKYNEEYFNLCNKAIRWCLNKYKDVKKSDISANNPFESFEHYEKLIDMTIKMQTDFEMNTIPDKDMQSFYLTGKQYSMFYGSPFIPTDKNKDEDKDEDEDKEKSNKRKKKGIDHTETTKKQKTKENTTTCEKYARKKKITEYTETIKKQKTIEIGALKKKENIITCDMEKKIMDEKEIIIIDSDSETI